MPKTIFISLAMIIFAGASCVWAQDYEQLYPSDGVKIGKVTYRGSEKKADSQLAKILMNKEFHSSKCPAGFKRTYLYNTIDLNGDGKPEVLAYVMGDCGGRGGYPLLVLSKKDNIYKVVSETTIVRQPIIVSTTKTKGWKNLIVSAAGDSAHPYTGSVNHYVLLKWNGAHYPSNTNAPPAENLTTSSTINGEVILANIVHAPGTVIDAIPLE